MTDHPGAPPFEASLQKEDAVIFRQFLAPKTGCASYLFG
jgi:hypothetical protein